MCYSHSPAAGICHSWWTRAHEGLGVCGSWRTAIRPEWWQVWSECGYPACEPAGGPAWTEEAGLKEDLGVTFILHIHYMNYYYLKNTWKQHYHTTEKHSKHPNRWTLSLYLVVEHEQDGAANTDITRPLHLETISLLGGGSSVPLKQDTGQIIQY